MSRWFRKGLPPYQAALAMIGAKAGDNVIVAGAADPRLIAELALVTGLNGETTVVDDSPEAEQRVTAAAAEAGALVEFVRAPPASSTLEPASRDIAVLMAGLRATDEHGRGALVDEALRVLRAGGRTIVVEGTRRTGPLAALRTGPAKLSGEEVLRLLDRPDTRAWRHLGDADGVSYYEARKV
jgi:ubiquinone/menaquinone biosynthesis C-methylase UbiE